MTEQDPTPQRFVERWCLREELEQTEQMYLAAASRADRYRGAWRSARSRAARATGTLDGVQSNLAAGTPLICSDERHAAKVAVLQQRLADEHATAVTRAQDTDRVRGQLAAADARITALQAECDGLAEASRNESRIWAARAAAVRALHYPETSMWDGLQCYLCGDPGYPCDTVKAPDGAAETALDGPADSPAVEPERPAGWCPTCEGQPRQATP